MTTIRLSRPVLALLALGAALASTSALADSKSGAAEAQARYQQERAVCISGQSNQARTTCLTEAGAAFAQARREGWSDEPAQYARNQSQRCDRLPDEDRRACVARMQGQGSTSGSAAAGGIYREISTPELGAPSTARPDADALIAPAQ